MLNPVRVLAVGVILVGLTSCPSAPAQSAAGSVVVRIAPDGRPVLILGAADLPDLPEGAQALIVWGDATGAGERWELVAGPATAAALKSPSRLAFRVEQNGTASVALADGGLGPFTAPLDQLSGTAIYRAWRPLLTPPQEGRVLGTPFTLRRSPAEKGVAYPAAEAILLRGGEQVARIRFGQGQGAVPWDQIEGLPADLKKGPPAGTYTLKMDTPLGPQATVFAVEAEARRQVVTRRPDELARLLGGRDNALWVQTTAEHLLGQVGQDGQPRPYLTDALDVLDLLPADRRTPAIEGLRNQAAEWLRDPGQTPVRRWTEIDPTGDNELDAALAAVATTDWVRAERLLGAIKPRTGPAEKRIAALAELYRGVIAAEAGPGQEEVATACFRRAIRDLGEGNHADLFRAHNNYANFLLTRAIDRLYNQAFLIATGTPRSLRAMLELWDEARRHFERAEEHAATLPPRSRATALINEARLYVVLGDVLRALRHPTDPQERFEAGERAADATSALLADRALAVMTGTRGEPLLVAGAEEVKAHAAYRKGDLEAARSHGGKALEAFAQAGAVPGQEGVHRLLGLCRKRQMATGGDFQWNRKEALRHFLLAYQLGEHLRDRYPADRTGANRAGFFARRAYVCEQIVELFLAGGEDAEALRYAELAKARSLRDLLEARRIDDEGSAPSRDLADLPSTWPEGMVALEYFLGAEHAWVFVVGSGGKVRAYELKDADRPVLTQDLVGRVTRTLRDVNGQAKKMASRWVTTRDFDHAWQDALFDLRRLLIPQGAFAEVTKSREVLIVPHHVLHYFPFAALVTRRDERERRPGEMAQPRFLVDEGVAITYAPSLAVAERLWRTPRRAIREVNALGVVDLPGMPRLDGVREELGRLRAAFGEKVGAVHEGATATRDRARGLLGKPGLLLVGTHGSNDPDRPLDSSLHLYPRAGDDGRLTAAGVYDLRVRSDVVVLNACYSGLGDRSPMPGDDLFGLQRALLQGGAANVVAGMWDIYDGTSPALMAEFFGQLAKGDPPAAALAAAQRVFLAECRKTANDPWIHPYFWAVYSVSGRPGTP